MGVETASEEASCWLELAMSSSATPLSTEISWADGGGTGRSEATSESDGVGSAGRLPTGASARVEVSESAGGGKAPRSNDWRGWGLKLAGRAADPICSSQSSEVLVRNVGPWANRGAITGCSTEAAPSSRWTCLVRKSLISSPSPGRTADGQRSSTVFPSPAIHKRGPVHAHLPAPAGPLPSPQPTGRRRCQRWSASYSHS